MGEISGQYGVLRLLSRLGKAVQSFPVDSDVLTFGRDQSCDVRMYFTFVSPLHAKLVFEDGKVTNICPSHLT
jgi:pSer/pThr/pTyr-binding forkhead associated (FHA) protein